MNRTRPPINARTPRTARETAADRHDWFEGADALELAQEIDRAQRITASNERVKRPTFLRGRTLIGEPMTDEECKAMYGGRVEFHGAMHPSRFIRSGRVESESAPSFWRRLVDWSLWSRR
jgi:hypothetical protein